jgi:hypothetical protein
MLTDFYIALSPACFSLLGLWLVVVQINPGSWLPAHQRWVYAVALYFVSPGAMSLLALVDSTSAVVWRVAFVAVSVLGIIGVAVFGPVRGHQRPHSPVDLSDHLAHWAAIILYAAIAVLAIFPLHTLRAEGVLLTVLLLLGVYVALRLLVFVGAPQAADEPAPNPEPSS